MSPPFTCCKTRKAFVDVCRGRGILTFVPPCVMNIAQPLDVSFFGPFKAALKSAHTRRILHTAEWADTERRIHLTLPTKSSRRVVVDSVCEATALLRKKTGTVTKGWRKALLAKEDVNKDISIIDSSKANAHEALTALRTTAQVREDRLKTVQEARESKKPVPRGAIRWDVLFPLGAPWEDCSSEVHQAVTDEVVAAEAEDPVVQALIVDSDATAAPPQFEKPTDNQSDSDDDMDLEA